MIQYSKNFLIAVLIIISGLCKADEDFNILCDWCSDSQKEFVEELYVNIGLTESCYLKDGEIVSQKYQTNGPAIGYLQIELITAIDLLNQAIIAKNNYSASINNRCKKLTGNSLEQIRDLIKLNPDTLLDTKIQKLIFYLKFGNMSFKGIDFNKSLINQAKIWKKYWNTEKGKGTEEFFVKKVLALKKNV